MMGAIRASLSVMDDSFLLSVRNLSPTSSSAHHSHNESQRPTMLYRDYIRKYASKTSNGKFHCELCKQWVNKHRWLHFKLKHRYTTEPNMLLTAFTTLKPA